MPSYVIGSGEKLEVSANIKNDGEDAFNAMLYLQVNIFTSPLQQDQIRIAKINKRQTDQNKYANSVYDKLPLGYVCFLINLEK